MLSSSHNVRGERLPHNKAQRVTQFLRGPKQINTVSCMFIDVENGAMPVLF